MPIDHTSLYVNQLVRFVAKPRKGSATLIWGKILEIGTYTFGARGQKRGVRLKVLTQSYFTDMYPGRRHTTISLESVVEVVKPADDPKLRIWGTEIID